MSCCGHVPELPCLLSGAQLSLPFRFHFHVFAQPGLFFRLSKSHSDLPLHVAQVHERLVSALANLSEIIFVEHLVPGCLLFLLSAEPLGMLIVDLLKLAPEQADFALDWLHLLKGLIDPAGRFS